MDKYSKKEEFDFIQSLYDQANEQLKEIYKNQKENRDELLSEIAKIMLIYIIADNLMKMSKNDRDKEYFRLSKMVTKFSNGQVKITRKVMNNILNDTVKNTYNFYSYNAKLKDVENIINKNFKGKHFSSRVWDNEEETAKYLRKKIQDFLRGKVDVNKIKKDIEKTFDTSAYNARRLVETEVNRCSAEAFKEFARETGVTKVRRNEVMDARTCSICARIDGEIYNLEDAPDVVHPLCRGYNTIEE